MQYANMEHSQNAAGWLRGILMIHLRRMLLSFSVSKDVRELKKSVSLHNHCVYYANFAEPFEARVIATFLDKVSD